MSSQFLFFSLANIFAVYPSIFKELIASRKKGSQIFLPSDEDWQEKMYYILLDVQKQINEAIDSGMGFEEATQRIKKPIFDPLRIIIKISPTCSPNGLRDNRVKCKKNIQIFAKKPDVWSLDIICKASKLLHKPPLAVEFLNELEMRKVYSLIYDVFRYKMVMSIALNDVRFYEKFPGYLDDQSRVWLMFYELLCRRFKVRTSEELELQKILYYEAKVTELGEILWELRISLAASISRVRVKYKALSLSELLPTHLQNDKVAIATANPIVTGWINPFLIRDKIIADKIFEEMGFSLHQNEEEKPLEINQLKWDKICPLFVSFIPPDRNEFTRSKIVSQNMFIMQDKTFAYGPAIVSKLLDHFDVEGDILQTHIDSPRATAYLASLFLSVSRVNNFYVYGAGSNLREYRKYMENLGITNIRIFEESFTSFPLESNRFRSVVGVFVNPPNSFSGIADPIDLICSRGGDLNMLKVLTESDISNEGKRDVLLILEEQLSTLQSAMSRPQIQFLLYQTHSIVDTENENMVNYVIKLVNQLTLDKHTNLYKEQKKTETLTEIEGSNIPSAALNINSSRSKKTTHKEKKTDSENQTIVLSENVLNNDVITDATASSSKHSEIEQIPDIDEFVLENIPDICINQDKCLSLHASGCFLSLIRRKNITRLNAKYLIKMAEIRGLFGKVDSDKDTKVKSKPVDANSNMLSKSISGLKKGTTGVLNIDLLITRLARETNASNLRNNLEKFSVQKTPITFNNRRRECDRYMNSQKIKCAPTKGYYWKYILRCLKNVSSITKLNTSQHRINKKFIVFSRRLRYPIKINEIKFIYNLT